MVMESRAACVKQAAESEEGGNEEGGGGSKRERPSHHASFFCVPNAHMPKRWVMLMMICELANVASPGTPTPSDTVGTRSRVNVCGRLSV